MRALATLLHLDHHHRARATSPVQVMSGRRRHDCSSTRVSTDRPLLRADAA
jgi:hypothetical protein